VHNYNKYKFWYYTHDSSVTFYKRDINLRETIDILIIMEIECINHESIAWHLSYPTKSCSRTLSLRVHLRFKFISRMRDRYHFMSLESKYEKFINIIKQY